MIGEPKFLLGTMFGVVQAGAGVVLVASHHLESHEVFVRTTKTWKIEV